MWLSIWEPLNSIPCTLLALSAPQPGNVEDFTDQLTTLLLGHLSSDCCYVPWVPHVKFSLQTLSFCLGFPSSHSELVSALSAGFLTFFSHPMLKSFKFFVSMILLLNFGVITLSSTSHERNIPTTCVLNHGTTGNHIFSLFHYLPPNRF